VREQFKQGQSTNSGNILISTDGGCGDLADSCVSLTFGTPESTSTHYSHYARKAVSKTAAPLVQNLREQRVVIRFLRSQGAKTVEIYRRMLLQYGDSCLAQRKVYD
jgi:hypothetical protein